MCIYIYVHKFMQNWSIAKWYSEPVFFWMVWDSEDPTQPAVFALAKQIRSRSQQVVPIDSGWPQSAVASMSSHPMQISQVCQSLFESFTHRQVSPKNIGKTHTHTFNNHYFIWPKMCLLDLIGAVTIEAFLNSTTVANRK